MIKSLFFDLIRVAIGRQECLSGAPSREDWEALFAMAEKQALMGVCFAGIGRLQKVGADHSATQRTAEPRVRQGAATAG